MQAEEKLAVRTRLCPNFIQDYGSTVSGCMSSLYGPDLKARPETVGRVQPLVALQVVDDENRLLPPGEVGQIRVRAPGMATTTYGGAARKSGDTLKDGWAYPGDLGALDETGFLSLMGRSSDVIIRGGANVHPSEVEAVIAQHEGVRDLVVVVGFTKLPEGQEIAAFVVSSSDLTEAALDAHCCKRLAPDKRRASSFSFQICRAMPTERCSAPSSANSLRTQANFTPRDRRRSSAR